MTLIKRPFIIFTILFFAVFWIVAYFTDAKPLAEFIRLVQISLAIAVVISYSRDAWVSALKPSLGSDDFLLLGIVMAWGGAFLLGSLLLVWRLAGQPAWLVNNDWATAFLVLQTYGAGLHLAAPGAIGGAVPRKNMIRIGAMVGLSVLAMFVLLVFSPKVTDAVRMLRPLIEQPKNDYDAPARFDGTVRIYRQSLRP